MFAAGADIDGINQLTGGDSRFSQDILDLMFLRLFEEQPDFQEHPPTFAAELAESHSWSADRKVLTVQLRGGVVWSDGAPITADDVVWTHEAQTNTDVAWNYSQSKQRIESVTALDPWTVEFRFRSAYAGAMNDVNEGVILPRHAWSQLPFSEWRGREDWFMEKLVSSGPYLLASRKPQEEIVLDRNPRYFRDGLPRIDRVVLRIIPNRTNQIEHLLAGEVDVVEFVPPERADEVEASERARLESYWHRQYNYIVWNGCGKPFDDPRVRLAMTKAIDREAIVEAIWGSTARIGRSPILSSVWAAHPDLEPWPYDPKGAAALLAAAGWSDTNRDGRLDREGRDLSFELLTNSGNKMRSDAAVMIQTDLRRIGVDVRLQLVEFNTLIDSNEAHDFDATIGAWTIDTSMDLRYAFHSDSIDNASNYGCYSNPEVDSLIERTKDQVDVADAKPLLHRIQEILHDEQPYTFLWEPTRLNGFSRRVRGAHPNPLSIFFRIDEWWLESGH